MLSGYTCSQLVAAAVVGLKSWTEKIKDGARKDQYRVIATSNNTVFLGLSSYMGFMKTVHWTGFSPKKSIELLPGFSSLI